MKKYLKVVEGSRGEVESLELVETSLKLIKKELDKHVKDLKDEGELDRPMINNRFNVVYHLLALVIFT